MLLSHHNSHSAHSAKPGFFVALIDVCHVSCDEYAMSYDEYATGVYQVTIGLYRDVWIAAIASSRKSLATKRRQYVFGFRGDGYVTSTSQCTLRSLRANPL